MLEGKFLNDAAKILLITLVLAVGCLAPATIMAKGGDDRDRQRFYGWVEAMPAGLHGTWIIGGRQVTTNSRTQFDQQEGPLVVGACVKVDIRGGLVHEIDSEPPHNCR